MIIYEMDGKIIIKSNVVKNNMVINHTLNECNIEIIEILNDMSLRFNRRPKNVIFRVKQDINHIDGFELIHDNENIFVFIDEYDHAVSIPIEPKTESKKYSYMLKIKSLNKKLPSTTYGNSLYLQNNR